VGAAQGQYIKLDLAEGSADAAADYGDELEYWDGADWQAYDPGTFVQVPIDASPTVGEPTTLLVRVPIKSDPQFEGAETLTLTVSNTGGTSAVGTCTIVDDGSGRVYASDDVDPGVDDLGRPEERPVADRRVVDPEAELLADDDRPLAVNDVVVNEASPYLIWTVTAEQGQYVSLSVASGSATLAEDTSRTLQFWAGSSWVDYVPGTFVQTPIGDPNAAGELLVRVAVRNDFNFEDRETLHLTATNTGGTSSTGTGTIRDDGEGLLFGPDNHTPGTPNSKESLGLLVLDDDRVSPPLPPPPGAQPAPPEPPRPEPPPALHVQMAVAEGRQPSTSPAVAPAAAGAVTRSAGSLAEGINTQRRLDALYDKFDRPTDPNLFVLPQVKDVQGQSSDVKIPSFTIQSGLLVTENERLIGSQLPVSLSEAPTLADQTLAAMAQDEAAVAAERDSETAEGSSETRRRIALLLQEAMFGGYEASGSWVGETAADGRSAADSVVEGSSRAESSRGQLGFRAQMQAQAGPRPLWQGGDHG
jgi:hypothetical protein